MARLEVVAFDEEHVGAAGRLLAERHRRHREAEPLLTARFEDPEAAAGRVAEALVAEGASGAAALQDGRLVGYVVGAPKPGEAWGPNVWVEAAGHAADGPEVARALYAAAAQRWVDEGRTAHYVLLPAADPMLVDAWFRLAFGHQHTHALREPTTEAAPLPAGLAVRRAVPADRDVLARLDVELPRHQRLSPTFSSGRLPTVEEARADWEDVDDPDFTTFVAEHEGRVIGSAVGCALERSGTHTGPARPDRAAFLGFAAVFPDARGLGAGRALGEAVTAWAAESGYDVIVTDWRETNLTSSRAWRSIGYRDTFLRLHRLVGH